MSDNAVTIIVEYKGETYRRKRVLGSVALFRDSIFDRLDCLDYELHMTARELLREIEYERTGEITR